MLSFAMLGLIPWLIQHYGETNLPPLILQVRYGILALIANCVVSHFVFVSDPKIISERPRGWFWLALIGCGLAFIWPVFSGDVMEYLIHGRMLGLYHVSPYRSVPNDFPQDILHKYSVWAAYYDSYGPISVYLQTVPAVLFQKSITGMIWCYKLIILGAFAAAAMFFWKITQCLKWVQGPKLWAMFAYSPFVVVLGLIDGHNDVVMMAFSVVSVYFLTRKHYGRAFFFWTCAFLVKYMVFLQLPFMIIIAVKDRWSTERKFPLLFVVRQTVINMAIIVLCYWPIWGGAKTFLSIMLQKGSFYTNTIPYFFHQALHFVGLGVTQDIVKVVCIAIFCFYYAYLIYRSCRGPAEVTVDFFRIASLAYLMFYAMLPSPLCAWYLLWPVFLIILTDWPHLTILVTAYSMVGLLAFFKRPNYLAVLAVGLYILSLLVARLLKRAFPGKFFL